MPPAASRRMVGWGVMTTSRRAKHPVTRINLSGTEAALSPNTPIEIRNATSKDQSELEALYLGARLTDTKDPIADQFDVKSLVKQYIDHEDSRLWIAEIGDSGPAGMIGLWPTTAQAAELRHLRVSAEHRSRGIGRVLVEHALDECRKRDILKVVLDTYVERKAAVALFEKLGFQLSRTREVDGKEIHDFYLNLYTDEG